MSEEKDKNLVDIEYAFKLANTFNLHQSPGFSVCCIKGDWWRLLQYHPMYIPSLFGCICTTVMFMRVGMSK